MSTPDFIPYVEGQARLDWLALTRALEEGHKLPRAEVADEEKLTILERLGFFAPPCE